MHQRHSATVYYYKRTDTEIAHTHAIYWINHRSHFQNVNYHKRFRTSGLKVSSHFSWRVKPSVIFKDQGTPTIYLLSNLAHTARPVVTEMKRMLFRILSQGTGEFHIAAHQQTQTLQKFLILRLTINMETAKEVGIGLLLRSWQKKQPNTFPPHCLHCSSLHFVF